MFLSMTTFEHLPNLRHLRVFEAAARLGSVTRASRLVHLSQPAVTQAISKLDEIFGAKLFERGPTGSYLTPSGEIVLLRTRRLFASITKALEDLFHGPSSGEGAGIASVLDKITITQIRCLLAVAENISFDQAARSIGVSQPSLHRAARDLERHIRRTIYYRGARGVSTTKQGSELARRLMLALRELDYAFDEVNARQGAITSRIVIGMLAGVGSFVLAHAIDEFVASSPGARVQIVEEPYEQLLSDLRSGKIDFLFSVLRRPDWAFDVNETKLFDESYAIVMRPGHPLAKRERIGRKDLARYDWIVPGHATPRYRAFEQLFSSSKAKPTTRIETASRGLVRALITMSDRLTLLARHEALLEERLGVLRVVPAKVRMPRRTYGVATRLNWQPTALQQQFLRILIAHGRRATISGVTAHGR
jgi:LysR family transcriptional regulator of gallate degradation